MPKRRLVLFIALGLGLLVVLSIGTNLNFVSLLFVAVCSVTGGPCDP